jgi:hypothetical protein
MSADFETWATRGVIVLLCGGLATMAGLLKKAQDERIRNLEAAHGANKAEFQENLEKLISRFTEENAATRAEFARTVTVISEKMMELGNFFTKMELTMQSQFTVIHDYQKEIRRDVRDVGAVLYGRRIGDTPPGTG